MRKSVVALTYPKVAWLELVMLLHLWAAFRKLANWQMDMVPKSFRKRYMNPFGLGQLGRYAIAVVSGSVNNSTNSVGITLPLNTTQQLAKLQMPQLRVTESEEHTATRLLHIFSFDGSSPELRFD